VKEGELMAIQHYSEDVLLVYLPFTEPQIAYELAAVNELVGDKGCFDVIIDFSKVEMIGSASTANLIILKQFLKGLERQLVLCNVSHFVKGVFKVAGLETFLDFAADKPAALESLQGAKSHSDSGVTENS
jgi:anti-anti-sigma factor